jgi:hypothetical protein
VAAVLDGPTSLLAVFAGPGQQLLEAVLASVDSQVAQQLSGDVVDRGCGMGGFVGIDADDQHPVLFSPDRVVGDENQTEDSIS